MKLYTKDYLTWPAIISNIRSELGVKDVSDTTIKPFDTVLMNCHGQRVPDDVTVVSCPFINIGSNDTKHIKHWICNNNKRRFQLMDDIVIRLDIYASILLHLELLTSGSFLSDSNTPFIERIMDQKEFPVAEIISSLSLFEVVSAKELIELERNRFWTTDYPDTIMNTVDAVSGRTKLNASIYLPYRVTYYGLYKFVESFSESRGSMIYKDTILSYINELPMSELFDDMGWKEEN